MNIQIFGSSKSFDSKKAERWFKERRIKYQYIDLYAKGLSLGDRPLAFRSIYWYLMRRSLNQRSAFLESKDLLEPKI